VADAAGEDGSGIVEPGRLAQAIRYAVSHGARLILLGSGSAGLDQDVAAAVALAESKGIPVVAPAGGSESREPLYPAALPTVISVAAEGDAPVAARAIAVAPGTCTVAPARGGGTVDCNGSSVAAARVAGIVAELLEREPGLTPAEVRSILQAGGGGRAAGFAARDGDTRGRLQYSDRAGTDIVMDAPWRTVRDYIPVLFFFPQFEGSRRVERIRIFECVGGEPVGPPVVVDAAAGPDTLNGASFVGPRGESREGLDDDERVGNFWHYIVRVPHAALSRHASPDVHDLRAEVEWSRSGLFGRRHLRNYRVLRVIVDPARFPRFDPVDRYFDTHVHTIAEQTTSGWLDVNGAAKAFAGPVIMLLESAYALGLVEAQPRENSWSAYADSIVVTDHNIFYSREPYDTGVAPRFGPTAGTDGHAGEAAWYRGELGRLAGEEITLRRGTNQAGSTNPNIGHHLLAYGTRHFEGPWHGGLFLTSGLENPNTLEAVLAVMKASGPAGFAYAAHPNLETFVWPPEYYAQAIGLPPYNSIAGPLVDTTRTEFLFKGSEVWNTKIDAVAHKRGSLPASSAFDRMNPFEGGPSAQRFERVAWDGELSQSLDTLFALVGRGLRFAFREAPDEVFIRKLYLSAGSDAHGDFNYSDEVTATAVPYSGYLHRNAFARVRTYVLAHDRPPEARDAVAAFAEGNSVITDGPILMYSLDADGRHDPGAGAARWHDGASRWENADGRIGGSGPFDGGRTALVPLPGDNAWIRSAWKRSVTPGQGVGATIRFDRVTESARDSFHLAAGPADVPDERRAPVALERLCALVATARDTLADERCITNPVWAAPVGIEIAVRLPGPSDPGGPHPQPFALLPPRALRVVFHFPFSMSASAPVRAALRALDSLGVSTDPEWKLAPDPGWESEGEVASSRLTVTNADSIPAPPGDWDAGTHAPVPGVASFVVYLERPADVHGNALNDVARAFALPKAPSPGGRESR
jgi:hypothetical protein